jgi:hypothetical protein
MLFVTVSDREQQFVALLASAIPAGRAASMDPMRALRMEYHPQSGLGLIVKSPERGRQPTRKHAQAIWRKRRSRISTSLHSSRRIMRKDNNPQRPTHARVGARSRVARRGFLWDSGDHAVIGGP